MFHSTAPVPTTGPTKGLCFSFAPTTVRAGHRHTTSIGLDVEEIVQDSQHKNYTSNSFYKGQPQPQPFLMTLQRLFSVGQKDHSCSVPDDTWQHITGISWRTKFRAHIVPMRQFAKHRTQQCDSLNQIRKLYLETNCVGKCRLMIFFSTHVRAKNETHTSMQDEPGI